MGTANNKINDVQATAADNLKWLVEHNPALKDLIEKFDLEIEVKPKPKDNISTNSITKSKYLKN